jgi:hypothetical protein
MTIGMDTVRALIPVPDDELVPPPELFLHPSRIHGQAHVARVLVHAFRLVAATGCPELMPRLWAAVYLHDIARLHDGRCHAHGADAWARLATLPHVRALFARGGVRQADDPAIQVAVTLHSKGEAEPGEPHARLVRLIKDADGLDRVRLYDLDPGMLRHDEARAMVPFAERLHRETHRALTPGPDYFARIWPAAQRLAGCTMST